MFRVRYSPNTILLVAVFALLCLQNSCQGFSILSRTKNDLSLWRKQFATKRNSPPSLPESPSSTDALNIRGGSATLEVPEQQKTTTGLENTHGFQPAKNAGFWSKELLREMLAEAIGTYIVVQLGLGSVVAAIYEGAHVGLFQVAAVWAIVVTIAIAVTGPISGAHLNPAMSLAFALLRPSKAFSFHKFLPYTFAQLIGAITGSWVNLIMFKESILKFEETNHIARGTVESIASAKAFGEYYLDPITAKAAFFIEFLATATLSFIIFSLTNPKNDIQKDRVFLPPLIGLTVAALVSCVAPLTQCGMNPARDFGPRITAFFGGWKAVAFKGWWVYVFAPLIGAPFGGFLADKVLYAEDK